MTSAETQPPWIPRWRTCITVAGAFAILTAGAILLRAADDVRTPNAEMRDAQGRRVRLTDFHGTVVLVDFWASWCAPCRVSFPALDALYREYGARGVEFVAVDVDEHRRDADAFLASHPHQMLVLFDPRARVLQAFGAPGVPSSYLIDRQGTIRYRHVGNAEGRAEQYRWQLDALIAEVAR